MKLPADNKRLIQSNRSSVLGDIYSSFNLDLSSDIGKIKVSPRGLLTTTSGTVADLGVATSFKLLGQSTEDNYGIYTTAGTKVFANSGLIYGNFTAEATGPTLSATANPDLEIFDEKLFVSGLANGDLAFLGATGNWSSTTTSSIDGPMRTYGNKLYFTLLGSQIGSTVDGVSLAVPNNNPNTVASTLNLGNFGGTSRNTITCIKASSNRLWIGTINRLGGKGRVYEWDGASTDPIRFYELQSGGALAMAIVNDVPWIMDTDGRLLAYNGGAFIEKARLPVDNYRYLKNPFDSVATNRFIHFNGMSVAEDRIQLLINGQYQKENLPVKPELPSGLWEYTEENGLYHKGTPSTWIYQTTTEATDYGLSRLASVGALATFKSVSTASNYNGSFIYGAEYYTDATTTAKGIFIDDTNDIIAKTGFLVTPEIHSPSILDNWQNAVLKHKPLQAVTDIITIKYRTKKEEALEITGTWTSTTTFTTTTNLTAYTGDEVFVTNGKGAGLAAHITTVTGSSTYTVTLDEAIGAVSGTFKALVENWTKATATVTDTEYFEVPLSQTAIKIQLKVYFKVTGKFEMFELQPNNIKHK